MLLTFNVLLDRLLDKSKTQTIRANYPLWQDRARKARNGGDNTFSIWWRNPRTMKYHPDCYKMGTAKWRVEEFEVRPGTEFTQEIANRDGFNDVEELWEALRNRNKTVRSEVLMLEWAILRWDWVDGPHVQPMAALHSADLITLNNTEDPL